MSRILKPMVMGSLTYGSVWALGGSPVQAVALAAIPVVFGVLRVFTATAYLISSLVIIAGVVWIALTPDTRDAVQRQINDRLYQQDVPSTKSVSSAAL